MKNFDVVALGELLIDFTENGKSAQGNMTYEANPGGAPCNVLAMLNKAGRKTAFIGKVGQDLFGNKLKATLDEVGIDTSNLIIDEDARTTLAFVETFPDGDRDFSFYRNPGADMMLRKEDLHEDLIRDAKIFHYGTLSMTHDGVREATKKAIDIAKESGAILSFDPNLRPPLWDSMERAREKMHYGFDQCDILKIADNELQFATGETDFDAGVRRLQKQYGIPLILLTLGKDGSRAYFGDLRVDAPAFLHDKVADTTGAGDIFGGSAVWKLLRYGVSPEELGESALRDIVSFACAAAGLSATRPGGISSIPEYDEILRALKQ